MERKFLEEADGVEEDEEDGRGADPAEEEYEQLEEGESELAPVGKLVFDKLLVDIPAYKYRAYHAADREADVG